MTEPNYAQIDVVIKITERCNIDCTYCYMFNMGNDDFTAHPAYITAETTSHTAQFLADGVRSLGIKTVRLIFHGGEPLMLKKAKFRQMCETYKAAIAPIAKLYLSLQTNAILVDEEWIAIFQEFDITIGVSLDGPPAYNDSARVDHQGRGTHAKVVTGLRKLQAAKKGGQFNDPGILCVIDPTRNAREIYRHFVDDIKATRLSFLMPMETHETATPEAIASCGDYLCQVFDEWVKDDNAAITIRIIDQVLRFMTGQVPLKTPELIAQHGNFALLTIASNGDIGLDDDLKPLNIGSALGNVAKTSLRAFLEAEGPSYINTVSYALPTACLDCCWQNYCRGGAHNGSLINRYSTLNGFNNPSVFCTGLKQFYSHLAGYMLAHGLDTTRLATALNHENSPYKKTIPAIPLVLKQHKLVQVKRM
jgi:uncharacterized protein